MKNDDGSIGNLTAMLLFSLVFSSVVIAYFCTATGYGFSVEVIDPITSLESMNVTSNFEAMHSTDWQETSIGYICNVAGAVLLVKNIKSNNNIITNYYYINNSVLSNYEIILEQHGTGFLNKIQFRDDGIHFPSSLAGDIQYIPYSNVNRVPYANIKTVYNVNTKIAKLTFNGNEYTSEKLNTEIPFLDMITTAYYGGVEAGKTGFNLISFKTNNQISSVNTSNPIDLILSFVFTVLNIIVWNVDSTILPWELNILLIKTQCMALLVCVVIIVRGGT